MQLAVLSTAGKEGRGHKCARELLLNIWRYYEKAVFIFAQEIRKYKSRAEEILGAVHYKYELTNKHIPEITAQEEL